MTIVGAGCTTREVPPQPSSAPATPIESSVERGPVRMTVRADKDRVMVAEPLTLTFNLFAPAGVDIKPPEPKDELGAFRIRNHRERGPLPEGTGRRWQFEFDVESDVSGDLSIPAVSIAFVDQAASRPGGEAGEIKSEIASRPVTIKVVSMLPGEFDPTKFRDIKGPVAVPVPGRWSWVWWTLGAGAAVVIVAALLRRRRRRRIGTGVVIPPDEWALGELLRLEREKLAEAGRLQEYYLRLSHIVRQYIEMRFAIRAPEQTTEEFLREASDHPALGVEHKTSLADFLSACDQVKFARYEPDLSESKRAMETARAFVERTRPRAAAAMAEAAA